MSDSPQLTSDELKTWRAFATAAHLFFEHLDRELQQDAGMPYAYYEVLARLAESPEKAVRMGDLAECLRWSPSRLSHAVERLEKAGWVRRLMCPTDRRGCYAALTDDGAAALETAAPGHVETVRRHLFDELTPEQVAQLGEISESVVRHLSVLDAHAEG